MSKSHGRSLFRRPPQAPTLRGTATTLDRVVALLNSGKAEEALRFADASGSGDRDVNLLNAMAFCALSIGMRDRAEDLWKDALAINPEIAALHNNIGTLLQGSGRYEEASASYRKALELKSDFAAADFNLGTLSEQCGRFSEAEASYRQVLQSQPNGADTHFRLANVLRGQGRIGESEESYRQAVALNPAHAAAHNNLGALLQDCRRPGDAVDALRTAIGIKPDYVEAHYNLGNVLRDLGQIEQSESSFRRALHLDASFASAHNDLGNLLRELRRFDEAERSYRCAITARPHDADAHYNLGALQQQLNRLEEAGASYRDALALEPDHIDARCNLSVVLREQGRLAEAEFCCGQVLAKWPDHAEAAWNLSLMLLSRGEFGDGWRYHEARYHPSLPRPIAVLPTLPYPQWRGEPLSGKSLVLWPEQGFGDEIQFCRYVAVLKRLGAMRVTLICKRPLCDLFRSLVGVDAVVALDEAQNLPPQDYWTLLLDLPRYCGTKLEAIPAALPYLQPSNEAVSRWAPSIPRSGLRVGLVWKGFKGHTNDANRSFESLRTLAPLWEVQGTTFISLQKGEGEGIGGGRDKVSSIR